MDNNTYLPSTQDLADIYGAGNPMTYRAAEQNLGTMGQFQQEALRQKQNTSQEGFLKNQFDEQNNPQKLEELRLKNEGTDTTNQTSALTLARNKANQQALMDEDKRKAILGATDFEIKQFGQQVEQMMTHKDPNVRAQGKQLYELIPSVMELRQKHKDEMEKVNTQRTSAEKIAAGNNETSREVARINQAGQNDRAAAKQVASAKGKTIMDSIQAGKINMEKGAVAFSTLAMFENDPDIKAKYEEAAQKLEEANQRAKAAGAIGKVDPGPLGLETTKPQTVLGNKPKPGTAENPIVLK